MAKLTDRSPEMTRKLVLWTKFAVLIYAMLISVPYLHNVLYVGKKLSCAWMALLILYLFCTNLRQFRLPEYGAMLLCCVFYGVTILLNGRAHFSNEVMVLLYMGCTYFLLTFCCPGLDREQAKKELYLLGYTMVVLSFVFALLNLGWYFLSYLNPMVLPKSDYFYGVGNHQLGGIYNPNTGGVNNYTSILVSLMLLRRTGKPGKVFLIVNMLLQFACFSLVQSRGAWIAFLAFLILYFLFVWEKKGLSMPKTWLYRVVLLALCTLVLTNGSRLTRQALSETAVYLAQEEVHFEIHHTIDSPYEMVILEPDPDPLTSDRDYTRGGHTDVTTGRSGLWKIGLKVWKDHPVFGIGYRSIDDALKVGLSEYDYHNSGAGGLHNVYITVLVSGGILGFVSFAALIVFLLLRVLKLYLDPKASQTAKLVATLIPTWLVGELVESRIALSFTNMSVFFWITAGYVIYYTRKDQRV